MAKRICHSVSRRNVPSSRDRQNTSSEVTTRRPTLATPRGQGGRRRIGASNPPLPQHFVQGRLQGSWIHPQRGIRQGCRLAPLLFILAADALAVCTLQLCRSGSLTDFQSPSVPSCVPLLQYADDMTFFIQGSWAAAHTLSTMMDIFSDFSGLQLN